MQKSLIVLVVLLVNLLVVKAQPILTAAEINPIIGEKYKLQVCQTFSTLRPLYGENQFYDFRNLVDSGPVMNIAYVLPKGLFGVDSFPESNIASIISGPNFIKNEFYKTNINFWASLGVAVNDKSGAYIYTDKPSYTIFSYPFTFASAWFGTCEECHQKYGCYSVADTLVGVGYGTLILPNTTYNNVLCCYNGDNSYAFYANGIHFPLLTIYQNQNSYSAQYTISSTLPIKISAFTVTCQDNYPNLEWDVANSENVKSFNIQRSFDGQLFSKIGQLGVVGLTKYKFIDSCKPNNVVYYRLEQLNKDGSFDYSKIVSINSNIITNVSISPNPVMNLLNVKVNTNKAEAATLEVIDFLGRILIEQKVQLQMGYNSFEINSSSLKKGNYFLVIKGLQIVKKQFLKQ